MKLPFWLKRPSITFEEAHARIVGLGKDYKTLADSIENDGAAMNLKNRLAAYKRCVELEKQEKELILDIKASRLSGDVPWEEVRRQAERTLDALRGIGLKV